MSNEFLALHEQKKERHIFINENKPGEPVIDEVALRLIDGLEVGIGEALMVGGALGNAVGSGLGVCVVLDVKLHRPSV